MSFKTEADGWCWGREGGVLNACFIVPFLGEAEGIMRVWSDLSAHFSPDL